MSNSANTPNETQPFLPQHLRYLADRGIPIDFAIKAGLESIDASRDLIAKSIKRRFRHLAVYPSSGLLIPYTTAANDGIHRARIRWDETRYYKSGGIPGADEESVDLPRYSAQKDVAVVPYYPPGVLVAGVVDDPSVDLFIVEAPVKALSLTANGFKAIGLGGVEAGFHDTQELKSSKHLVINSELDRVLWNGRRVFIAYDAGVQNNPRVALGAAKLASVLRDRGADARLVILPLVHLQQRDLHDLIRFDLDDQGPDDFLSRYGKEAFQKLVDEGVHADPVARVRTAMSSDKSKDEQRELVVSLLADLTFLAGIHVGGRVVADQITAIIKPTGIKTRAIQDQISKLLKRVEKQADSSNSEADLPYLIQDGRLAMNAIAAGVPTVKYLTEFTAQITEEILTDDGLEQTCVFKIEGKLPDGTVLPTIEVKAADFAKLDWISTWGARSFVRAGKDTRDHTRVAIQALSSPTRATVFTHLGWRDIDGRQVYLHPGGAIGAHLPVRVKIDALRGSFGFPSEAANVKEAVALSLSILSAGPLEITLPVLAAAHTSVLSELLEIDFGIWLVGPSGSYKSTLASKAQGHFGAFDYHSLPGNWFSTAGSLEALLFKFKDALVVIDNYVPGQTQRDQQQLVGAALRLIQCIGDRSGRGRLDRNSEERATRRPRGLAVMTGEDLPPTNESTLGRLLVIDVGKGSLNLDRLAAIQQKADRLPHALRAFIEWLAPKLATQADNIRQLRRETTQRYRADLVGTGVHERTPNSLAALATGFGLFLDFAAEVGAIDHHVHDHLTESADSAFIRVARRQRANVEGVKPTERYLSSLRALLMQGRVVLANKDQQLDFVTLQNSRGIGWLDGDCVYLMPDLAWEAVEQFNAREGWPFRKTQLHKQLADNGVIERVDVEDTEPRITTRKNLAGATRRVLKIHTRHFEDAIHVAKAANASRQGHDDDYAEILRDGVGVEEVYEALHLRH